MSSDLLTIGLSGAKAARTALDLTAQNIANAGTAGYVRRSLSLAEVSSTGGFGQPGKLSLSGVRVDHVVRNADLFRQAEARRTGADAARADIEIGGLQQIEAAIEQSRLYPSMVGFEGSLQKLASDPTDPSLRAGVVEAARTMAATFNIAANGLTAASEGLTTGAQSGVRDVNTLATELGRLNLRLARAADASSDQSALLDQRDTLLQQISSYGDISTTFNATNGVVDVRIGGSSGPVLVQGGSANALAMTAAPDGTLSFDVGGSAAALSGGSLAGQMLGLAKLAQVSSDLDAAANLMMSTVNTAQAGGAALDGSAGQPLFSGSGAAGMALAFSDGAKLATAPAGAPAGSRDPGNLDALRAALTSADPTGAADRLLFDISSTISSRKVTQGALKAIASNARTALEAQSGVDLDVEAVNLLRFQQAFQASGKAMQVAGTIFDTLINLR